VNPTPPEEGSRFDVAIIGGALSGAATAILLLREKPDLRVVIIEKSERFTRRVGEATVEVSSYFLTRVIGLTKYLNETHLVKNGLRFWFYNDRATGLEQCSEIGGRYLARVPSYLIDRASLDEEVLRRACALGAVLWRPASVQEVELLSGAEQKLTVSRHGSVFAIHARWVIDASGVAAFLARRNGWLRPLPAHPTTAVWSRWKGVKDFEDIQLARKFPEWARACYGVRGTATNHLMGDGWWAWWILLKGGDVSIGVTFDQRRVEWPEEGSVGDRLKQFLLRHPVARELMSEAEWTEGDVHWRKNLPYHSSTLAGDGFALVGDAAGFIDPFYSPGMDWITFTASAAADLVLAQQRGEAMSAKVELQNRTFLRSYERWFEAIYRDKYDYLGDFELMRLAFLLDLGLYYFGVASQPYRRGAPALLEPLFSTRPSVPFYHLMRAYNRRFAAMARDRRRRGTWGLRNDAHRFMFGGYTFSPATSLPVIRALVEWAWLELKEGWRTWFEPRRPERDGRRVGEQPPIPEVPPRIPAAK
jgi:flavin-dependent dehydrogenase